MTAIEILLKELEDRLMFISSPDLDSDLNTRMLRKQLSSIMTTARSYIPIEKQDLQKAFKAGEKYGDVLNVYNEFCPDFDQFYNELKGE